jgi:hypothetical protein
MGELNEQDFMAKINQLTTQYYSDNKKNLFYKNAQKQECANTITNTIGIEELMHKTCFIINDTNCVFIDYVIFKTFAVPENYEQLVEYILSLFNYCIQRYGVYEAHINLNSFTISAAERYKTIISLFINKCMVDNNSCYSEKITKMGIYNTPNTFNSISKILLPLVDNNVKQKIVLYDKNNSNDILRELFSR